MYPHDPYQQDPYQQQYPPPQYPQYPAYAPQPEQGTNRWAIVLWVAVPALLVILCCAGCVASGFAGGFIEGFNEGYSSS
ncbi:hypothetical protein NMK34_06085 [Micromonospora sp. BRA006-A]|uniref:hypothetical protein n=1 Tax=Micromonospora sp. BRA006-A TaxID=2962860 RepID=UPI00296F8AFE|nr:hypothetical protein [Micromonospora sp. BRA006-A]MDW3846173.1 hypothetical protein [Micromonospora sp. BRA006-A]MEE3919844.1 hypothetical protein [Micromonospora sp. BRA006-A]